MPYSSGENRTWLLNHFMKHSPTSVFDVGVGAGKYGRIFQQYFPSARRMGVEAWGPYTEQFNLFDIYDVLWLGDVRDIPELPPADIIIFGDVLEHMTVDEATELWAKARRSAQKACYISIPIVHYPQGAHEGNPYEEHVVDDWAHERVLETFEGISDSWAGEVVGAYEALS